jgi:hypothetical protein
VRTLAGLVAVMLMAMIVATPAWARVVRMQTAVNLTDHTDPGVKRALKEAFDTSLRGAVAMGSREFEWTGSRCSRMSWF